MAKKTYICQGGYLTNPETNKLEHIAAGTEYEIDEKIGDKCRLLKPANAAKKLVNNADPEAKATDPEAKAKESKK